jgi:hypothetical protein
MRYFDADMGEVALKKRYRQLAFKHHPDRGGDTETMARINMEFEAAMKGQFVPHESISEFVDKMASMFSYALSDMAKRKPRIETNIDFISEFIKSLSNVKTQ